MKSVRDTSPIIATYLAELDAATAHLPADEQFDIRDSIEAHIADMVGVREHIDAAEARQIVDHLGPVSTITQSGNTQPLIVDDATTRAMPTAPPMPMNHGATPEPAAARAPGYARIAAILAIVTMLAYLFFTPLSLITGIAAMVFGILGLRAGESRSEAWAGVLIGALPLVLAAIFATLGMSITTTFTAS